MDFSAMANNMDDMFDKDKILAATKNFRKPPSQPEPVSNITIGDELKNSRNHMNKMKSLILEQVNFLDTNSNTTKNLQQATDFYMSNFDDIKKKIENIKQKEKLNKRISQFYNNDYDLKKTMLYYLKIFYFIMVSLAIFTIIYKKKHKDKKMYGFLFLLLIIPYLVISNIYSIVLNNLGHLKIDVLYLIFLVIISVISYGLFFISKYILKKKESNGLLDILKDTADTLKNN